MNRSSDNRVFQAFEHASYNTRNEGKEGKLLPPDLFDALKNYAGDRELPYYSLTAYGIKFAQYVGALQIGKYCIEVLPKIDRQSKNEASAQRVLIEMLRQSGFITVKSPTESSLRIKRNFILETYIQMFLNETWQLIHKGLINSYHNEEGNKYTLKGSLIFNKNIQKNNIHAEKFYIRHTTYDKDHPLNRVLYKTLSLISKLAISLENVSDVQIQLVYFPELNDINVSDEFFQRIKWNRKTESYRKAIDIARLLLLNYYPDLSHGKNHVLALMFDMNDLWEQWFTKKLKTLAFEIDRKIEVRAQIKKSFWSGANGETIRQKPDILLVLPDGSKVIIDTKWKLFNDRPSEDDLRQMFAYNRLFESKQAYLVYPGSNNSIPGSFFNNSINGGCGLKFIEFVKDSKLDHSEINIFLNHIIRN